MMEMAEQEMSKAVLEIIDLRLSPILEKLEKIEAELLPIREKFESLEPTVLSPIRQDVDSLKKLLEAPQKCPKLEQFEALDEKFKVVANFLENLIYLVMKTQGANPCAEDIKGLAILRNEEPPSTEGLDKDQLKALFIQQMKTKAF
jgi:hypothetical protein